MNHDMIRRYTDAVLEFGFRGDGNAPPAATVPSAEETATFAERTLRLLEKSESETLILFGLEDGEHALALARELPEGTSLLVCETDPAKARAFLTATPEWSDPDSRASILADTSPWAHLYILNMSGVRPDNATMALNPALPEDKRTEYRHLQRLFMNARPHQAINSSYLSHVGVQAPDLSVGAILHPDEPGLDTFFAQFPEWVREVVVVWDAECAPDRDFACAAPIRHLARPLDDFASQRNHALDHCEGEWTLFLDGDESFSEDVWGLLTACMLVKRLEACWFPRMTLYPDETRCKAGYGLWPDLQLRLFRKGESVRFNRPVHERLTGITGRTALVLDAPILHYSRLRKSPEELAAKLKRFDETGGGAVEHVLNEDYPTVPRAMLPEASLLMGSLSMLLLEENPA
ncbi:glycosyl transferase family 2 [Pseudodesulfovibrio thermohalotolerans]|uniref:glycosyl transferase family 2 n=1 Tax=Pseudodesulfovibrio thermohalotolerans TaxID=2880651 RepID=UPI0024428F33|nr:glycosyl transferase family 2 [Pseudodesulfovibrio thermohalotolerans]WFS63733.1 glycosyl transferase family 2 [Pseudodesulfovibrio thermohalotolerans]